METTENNKLIAEFMGLTLSDGDWIGEDFIGHEPTGSMLTRNLRFHTSWDWLMPVVNKCMQTGDNTDEWDALYDSLSTVNIKNVYKTVVEFIKWYNENK